MRQSIAVKVFKLRRVIQWTMTAVVILIGIQFTLWVMPHLEGRWPSVSRPPGVEAFLPIDAMLGLRHLLHEGTIDAIHPAGLAIFIGICLMSLVVAKSFCSHVCPVGLLSELLGRFGIKLTGRTLTPPKWLDIPLRGLKFLLLGFFVWAIWFAMDPRGVEAFLESPYAKIVDAKMWLFFAPPSRADDRGPRDPGGRFDLRARPVVPLPLPLRRAGRRARPSRSAQGDPQPRHLHRLRVVHHGLPGPAAGPYHAEGGFHRVHLMPGLRRCVPGQLLSGGAASEACWRHRVAAPGDRDRPRGWALPGGDRRLQGHRPLAHLDHRRGVPPAPAGDRLAALHPCRRHRDGRGVHQALRSSGRQRPMYNPRMPASLADLPLLSQLTEEQRNTVIDAGHEKSLERGEILFHEGEPAEALYAVIDGQLKLVRYSPKGRELLLHLVNPGQTFAEAALFAPGTYPATAEVMQSCRLWCLPRAALLDLLSASPELGVAMLGSISLWTRKLASKLELHTQRRVEERVAIYLLSRAGSVELEPGDRIELAEPRNLIAAQCGTAPEVLSRTFRRLEDDGILEAAPHHVTIHDPDSLRSLAEWIE